MARQCRISQWLLLLLLVAQCLFAQSQTTSEGIETSTRLSLAASNPFRMVLRPTAFELDFVALSIVEEAMATAILLSTDSSLVDVNINVNQMNWLSPTGANTGELIDGTVLALGADEVPTTVLKFFAVGTFLSKVPAGASSGSGSLPAVKALDDIIKEAFRQGNTGPFINLLMNSGDPLLTGIRDVAAIPTNNNEPVPVAGTDTGDEDDDETEDNGLSLTTLDIILISVSASIFLGIVYMIFQHHKDRGYIENQRIQTLNAYRRNNDTSSSYVPRNTDADQPKPDKPSSVVESIKSNESSKTSLAKNNQANDDHPSHDSSLFTSSEDHSFTANFSLPPSPVDINTHLNSRMHRYSSKVRLSVESLHCDSRSLPPTASKPMTSSSSIQSQDDKSECKSTGALSTALSTALSSEFGPINWFRKSGSKSMSSAIANEVGGNIEEEQEEEEQEEEAVSASKNSTTSSSSSTSTSSDDVFHVGSVKTNVITTGSIANGSDTVVSKTSSIVTEWMKTIQVISSTDSKSAAGSEVTCKESSSEQSSAAENSSTEAPSVDDVVGDVESLEHSMANSKGMVGVTAAEDGLTMEF